MKKSWIIPACFLLIAALVNFVARFIGAAPVAAMVKPALLPLLALTTVAAAGGMESKTIKLLVIAQLLGMAGDIFLISSEFIAFAIGLVCFLVGHIFYCINFGGRSWKGLKPGQWVIAIIIMAAATAGLLIGIGVEGTFLVPFAVYGMMLMFLIWSALAGVIRQPKKTTWVILTCGALLFAFSDSLIAIQTFNGSSTFLEFLVMVTYVVAQCLLAWGGLRLYKAE
jgi:uncharacterized membrane protein YhhN